MDTTGLIKVARGQQPADLVLRGGTVVNTLSGELVKTDVAVFGDRIAALGPDLAGREEIDVQGAFIAPGLMDGHMHLESSMVTPPQYARAVVPRGTTAVMIDPHEIANVRGLDGIRYMLEASRSTPLDVFVMCPSCVPATDLENSGARLDAADLLGVQDPRILGLAEMMNFPGVLAADPGVLEKIEAFRARRVDGHCPGLTGRDLCAYLAAGVESDHECTRREEAEEKLRLGMHILLREGSVTRDLEALLPLVTPRNLRRCMLCTDDREPADLINEGHIDFVIRKAVSLGCSPVDAITMGSLNTAEYFGLRRRGAVAPGWLADLVVVRDLDDFRPHLVFKGGRLVARDGEPLWEARAEVPATVTGTVNFAPLEAGALRIDAGGRGRARVIGLIPHQIVTRHLVEEVTVRDGEVIADPERDQLKLAVVERHRATGNVGLGLASGFGLTRGALASTVGHDSHNLLLLGADDQDMLMAAERIRELDGGWVAVAGGQVLAELPLPIGGLMSDAPLDEVRRANEALYRATVEMGGTTPNPFMSLSFLALPVIPALKLTDLGLVDVDRFSQVELMVD